VTGIPDIGNRIRAGPVLYEQIDFTIQVIQNYPAAVYDGDSDRLTQVQDQPRHR